MVVDVVFLASGVVLNNLSNNVGCEMKILESAQVYSDSPYYNPSDHPAEFEQEEKSTFCGYCGDELHEDEDEYCAECQIVHDEYMRRKR